jgi:ProP effector
MSKSVGKVEITIAELVAAFPAAFTLDRTLVRPVKLGIKDDLYGQSAISHRRITAALRSYCNSVHYLRASTEGAVRIDLTGEPAGTVTAARIKSFCGACRRSPIQGCRRVANAREAPPTR